MGTSTGGYRNRINFGQSGSLAKNTAELSYRGVIYNATNWTLLATWNSLLQETARQIYTRLLLSQPNQNFVLVSFMYKNFVLLQSGRAFAGIRIPCLGCLPAVRGDAPSLLVFNPQFRTFSLSAFLSLKAALC
jgi:hypothetical protein